MKTIVEVLEEMRDTSIERGKVYGSNYKQVAPIMRAFFPDGLTQDEVFSHQFHMFELIVNKLARFANSGLTHVDSIHDAAVYAAMIESVLSEEDDNVELVGL